MRRVAIGALRHRVRIEAPELVSGAGGGGAIIWVEVATVWASIAAVSGREPVMADGLVGRTLYDVTIRYREGIDTSMRFDADRRVFDIVSAFDPDGRRKWLVCRSEEQVP